MSRFAIAACLMLLFLGAPSLARGQYPRNRPSRYEPAYGPTLSPYLLQNSLSTGVLNNYYNFVRPRVQLRSKLRSHERKIDRIAHEVRRAKRVSKKRDLGIMPTGIAASYMNFSHYYPDSVTGRR